MASAIRPAEADGENKQVFEFMSPKILILSHFPPSQVAHFYYITRLYISCIFLSGLTQRRKVIKGMTKNLNNLKQIKSGCFDKYFAVHRFNFCFVADLYTCSPAQFKKYFSSQLCNQSRSNSSYLYPDILTCVHVSFYPVRLHCTFSRAF